MPRKARRIFTDGPQLDYVSPWKINDTYRIDHYYLISKNKIMEEIIMPAQIQMQKKNEIIETQNNLSSPKKTNRTLHSFQSSLKYLGFNKNAIYSAHIDSSYNKKQRKKEFFDSIVFIRKSKPSSNLRVISLGNQNNQNQQIFQKRFSVQRPVQMPKQYEKMNRIVYLQKQNTKEQFKRLNLSLMGKLKYGTQQKQREATQRLNKTLKQFMKQQGQI